MKKQMKYFKSRKWEVVVFNTNPQKIEVNMEYERKPQIIRVFVNLKGGEDGLETNK